MSRITLQSMPRLRQRSRRLVQTPLTTSRPKQTQATRRRRIQCPNPDSQSGHIQYRKPTKQLTRSRYRGQIGRTSWSGDPGCVTFGRLKGQKLPGIGTPRSQTRVKINPRTRRRTALLNSGWTHHPLLKSRPDPEENMRLGKSKDSPSVRQAR